MINGLVSVLFILFIVIVIVLAYLQISGKGLELYVKMTNRSINKEATPVMKKDNLNCLCQKCNGDLTTLGIDIEVNEAECQDNCPFLAEYCKERGTHKNCKKCELNGYEYEKVEENESNVGV